MIIRKERPEDVRAVEELLRDAFWDVHTPGATEHYLAHRMREHRDYIRELSMVAERDGRIVGCIFYAKSTLICQDGTTQKCLTFGPLAVHPNVQRRGIGKKLVTTTLALAKALDYDSVVIFGHPGNYVGRGFLSCRRVNVCTAAGAFPTAMLVKPLSGAAFDGRKWFFTASDVYHLDETEAQAYDKTFPERETHVLPSQEEFYIYSHSRIP